MIELKNKWLILTKLSKDNEEFALVSVGSKEIQGYFLKDEILIGKQLMLYSEINNPILQSWTSKIKLFDEEKMILKTENSTYKVEISNEIVDSI